MAVKCIRPRSRNRCRDTHFRPYSAYYEDDENADKREKSSSADLSNLVETFSRTDIPFTTLFDLGEYPGFYERASTDHNSVDSTVLDLFPVVLRGETITATEDRYSGH